MRMSSAFQHLIVQLDLATNMLLYVDFLTVTFLSNSFNEGHKVIYLG